MALLLVILVLLTAVVICAVVLGLKRRRSRAAAGSHDINPAVHPARAHGDASAATGVIYRDPVSGTPKVP
jgi:hypothetical protein